MGAGLGRGVLQLGEPHPRRLHPSVQPERARGSCLSRDPASRLLLGKQLCSLEHASIRSPLTVNPTTKALFTLLQKSRGVQQGVGGVAGVEGGSPHPVLTHHLDL